MATALVVDLSEVGEEVFEIADQVASEEDAWKTCTIMVEGKTLTGYEREYEGRWIAYCPTNELIIYVLAPAALRFGPVELSKLARHEVTRNDGVPR
jgi:hypothetical protein